MGTVSFCLHCLLARNDIQCCIIHINFRSSGFNVAYMRPVRFHFINFDAIHWPILLLDLAQYVGCFLSLSGIPSAFICVVRLICAISIILSFCINVVAVVDSCDG